MSKKYMQPKAKVPRSFFWKQVRRCMRNHKGKKMNHTRKKGARSKWVGTNGEKCFNFPIPKSIKIGKYIEVKLERGQTVIYVAGQVFQQCKFLFLNLPKADPNIEIVDSIDEAEEIFAQSHGVSRVEVGLSAEMEFWGHASNLQAWAENNYDSRILHRTIAVPLLLELYRVGDPLAKKVAKTEFATRLEDIVTLGHHTVLEFFLSRRVRGKGIMDLYTKEERNILIGNLVDIALEEGNVTAINKFKQLNLIKEGVTANKFYLKALKEDKMKVIKNLLKQELVPKQSIVNDIITLAFVRKDLEFFKILMSDARRTAVKKKRGVLAYPSDIPKGTFINQLWKIADKELISDGLLFNELYPTKKVAEDIAFKWFEEDVFEVIKMVLLTKPKGKARSFVRVLFKNHPIGKFNSKLNQILLDLSKDTETFIGDHGKTTRLLVFDDKQIKLLHKVYKKNGNIDRISLYNINLKQPSSQRNFYQELFIEELSLKMYKSKPTVFKKDFETKENLIVYRKFFPNLFSKVISAEIEKCTTCKARYNTLVEQQGLRPFTKQQFNLFTTFLVGSPAFKNIKTKKAIRNFIKSPKIQEDTSFQVILLTKRININIKEINKLINKFPLDLPMRRKQTIAFTSTEFTKTPASFDEMRYEISTLKDELKAFRSEIRFIDDPDEKRQIKEEIALRKNAMTLLQSIDADSGKRRRLFRVLSQRISKK